ncbi:transmembrane protein [Cystoisospora suis]|uniref:Transmembrane protein n=1 Tax=Cystoisospora suis TaxID=483139 RepID=A0A2C6KZL0_9APIC|nr:transmembrane protein [Cystoisospora suis]
MASCTCGFALPPSTERQRGRNRCPTYPIMSDGEVGIQYRSAIARQGSAESENGATGLHSPGSSARLSFKCRAHAGCTEATSADAVFRHSRFSTSLSPQSESSVVTTSCANRSPRSSSQVSPVGPGGTPTAGPVTGTRPFACVSPRPEYDKNSALSGGESATALCRHKPARHLSEVFPVPRRSPLFVRLFSVSFSSLWLSSCLSVALLFPLCFLCEGRMIVTYPDTLSNYPPIVETYFAPWSQNFTSTSGRLRYFAKTCDLDHYFYLDEADLDGYPSSKGRHALHGLDFSDASLSLSLPGRDALEDNELPSTGESGGLLHGALRRLQESFPSVGGFPWVWWRPAHDPLSVSGSSLFSFGGTEVGDKQGSEESRSGREMTSNRSESEGGGDSSQDSIHPGSTRGSRSPSVSRSPVVGPDGTEERPGDRGGLFRFLLSRKYPRDPPQVRSKLQSERGEERLGGGIDDLSLLTAGVRRPNRHLTHAAPSGCLNCGDRPDSHPVMPRVSWMYRWASSPVTYLSNLSSYMPFSFRSPPAQYVLFRKGATDASAAQRRNPSVSTVEPSPAVVLHGDGAETGPVLSENSSSTSAGSSDFIGSDARQSHPNVEIHGSETAEEPCDRKKDGGCPTTDLWPSIAAFWNWVCSFSRLGRGEQRGSSLSPFVLLNTLVSPTASMVPPDMGRKTDISAPFSGRFITWPMSEKKDNVSEQVLVTTSTTNRQLQHESPHLSAWMPSSAFMSGDQRAEEVETGRRGEHETSKPSESGTGKSDALFLSNREEEGAVGDDKVLWLFDQCNDATAVQRLVNAANSNHAGALIFTNTTFSDTLSAVRFSKGGIDGLKQLAFSSRLPPSPSMPVFSIPDSRLTREIKDRLRSGDTVEVVVDTLPADYVNCALLEPVKWASLAFIPLWGGLALLWYLVCNYVSRFDVSPLHRLLLLPPVLKTAFLVTAFGFYAQCPDYLGNSTQYIMMAYMGLNTIFNTIFYGIFLLLAKGFMITREVFGRKESLSLALLVSLVYIITSVNQVEEAETLPALILLYVALLGSILTSAGRNIRHLQLRLAYVQMVRVHDWEAALNVKLWMLRSLYRVATAFFLLQISQKIILFEVFDRQDFSEIVGTVLEWLCFVALALIFRPREQILFFSLMQHTPETYTILPMYSARPYASRSDECSDGAVSVGGGHGDTISGNEGAGRFGSEQRRRGFSFYVGDLFRKVSGAFAQLRSSLTGGRPSNSEGFLGGAGMPGGSGSPIVILNPAAEEEEERGGYVSLTNMVVGTLVPPSKEARRNNGNNL